MIKTGESLVKWISWFKKHKSLINEVYLPPHFLGIDFKDMNGDNFNFTEDDFSRLRILLKHLVKEEIKICVIFNDIFTGTECLDNLLSVLNTKYGKLVDILVVPNNSWIKPIKAIRNIEIKNTVINLPTFEQIKNGEYDDYDMIYIHDEIIHNKELYKTIKGDRKFGTVVNFSDCSTNCSLKYHHYEFIHKGMYETHKTFCKTASYTVPEMLLKGNNIPHMLSEYLYYNDTIDIYKFQGRQDTTYTFESAKEIVENLLMESNILTKTFKKLEDDIGSKLLDEWKIKVRNCGGVCENCLYCNEILKDSDVHQKTKTLNF